VAVSGLCASPRGVAPRTVAGLLWWATVGKMLEWHLGMTEGPSGETRARLSSVDAVTLARFWLAALAPLARRSRYGLPAVIVVGGLSDWVDGALARRAGSTRLGRDLDTTADIAFFGAAAVSAAAARRLPAFSACALIGRYAAGTALTVRATFRSGRRPPQDAVRWGAILRVTGLVLATAG
jgi:phosphatidylglycerophosphate synthase